MREKTRVTSWTAALLLVGAATCAPALAGSYQETGGPTPVTPTSGYTWYNPTAITIPDGGVDYVYLYMQGGPNDSEPCDIDQDPATTNGPAVTGDAIYAMRAPLNPLTKLPGEFSRVGRISPCVPPPPGVPSIPPNIHAFFGPGQVFKSRIEGVDKYYLLADASNSALFREIWLGSSTDGKSWTWSVSSISQSTTEVYGRPGEVLRSIQSNPAPPLVTSEQLAGFYLLNPILVAKNVGQANEYWWGFFNFRTNDLVEKIGQMKVARNGGQWQASILTSTSPYQYSQLAGGNQLDVQPASVKNGAAKSLVWSTVENSFELWGGSASLNNSTPYSVDPGVAGCDTNLTAQCLEPPHAPNPLNGCETCTTGDNSCVDYLATVNAYLYNTGVTGPETSGHGMTFVWWRVSETSFDATERLVSSAARSMPGGNEFSRQFPARWDAPDVQGTRYLFSATNDANLCLGLLFSPYYKMYVVQTKLEYTPSPSTQSLAVTKSGTGEPFPESRSS